MRPARTHSTTSRMPSPEWPWMPIWVVSFDARAASVSWRASQTLWVRGFWV